MADTAESTIHSKNCTLGVSRSENGDYTFKVWAPYAKRVEVLLHDENRAIELAPEAHGYHFGVVFSQKADIRYRYRLDGEKERADPASRYQPEGVFGPSQVLDSSDFKWTDR